MDTTLNISTVHTEHETKIHFDHSRWHQELIEALGCYKILQPYCSDDETILAHLNKSWHIKTITDTGEVISNDKEKLAPFAAPFTDSIKSALETYSRQLIVVVVTIVEASIGEAFRVLYTCRPGLMHSLKGGNSAFEPSVTLDELMKAGDLSSLKTTIIERAVSAATAGGIEAIVKRIEKNFQNTFPTECKEKFIALSKLRNQIVHDHISRIFIESEITDYFDTGIDFLEKLGRMVNKQNLPLNDPAYIINEPPPPDEDQFIID